MFSARCAEMGESGFAPTRRITNRFWVYIWRCTKRILLDHAVVGASPTMPEKMKKKTNRYYWADVAGYVLTEIIDYLICRKPHIPH